MMSKNVFGVFQVFFQFVIFLAVFRQQFQNSKFLFKGNLGNCPYFSLDFSTKLETITCYFHINVFCGHFLLKFQWINQTHLIHNPRGTIQSVYFLCTMLKSSTTIT